MTATRKVNHTRFRHPQTLATASIVVLERGDKVHVDTWLPPGSNWSMTMPEWRDWCSSLEEARTAFRKRRAYLTSSGYIVEAA